MLSHSLLRIMGLLMIALLAPWRGGGHQKVTAKRSLSHIPMCGSCHGLTKQPCLPLGSSEAEGRNEAAVHEKRGMKHKQSAMLRAHQLRFFHPTEHDAEHKPSVCACPGTAEESSNMCGRVGRNRLLCGLAQPSEHPFSPFSLYPLCKLSSLTMLERP